MLCGCFGYISIDGVPGAWIDREGGLRVVLGLGMQAASLKSKWMSAIPASLVLCTGSSASFTQGGESCDITEI